MQLLRLLSVQCGNDSVSVVDCTLRLCSDTLKCCDDYQFSVNLVVVAARCTLLDTAS